MNPRVVFWDDWSNFQTLLGLNQHCYGNGTLGTMLDHQWPDATFSVILLSPPFLPIPYNLSVIPIHSRNALPLICCEPL